VSVRSLRASPTTGMLDRPLTSLDLIEGESTSTFHGVSLLPDDDRRVCTRERRTLSSASGPIIVPAIGLSAKGSKSWHFRNIKECLHDSDAMRRTLDLIRSAWRSHGLSKGSITFPYSGIAVDCVVRRFTDSGACLSVEYPDSIPDDFDLTIENGDALKFCHVVWRDAEQIGVEFR
jgi:hypothetical protein